MRSIHGPGLILNFMVMFLAADAIGGDDLASGLTDLAEAHHGIVAISVKNLRTGETFALNADRPMPTASLIKFPVMIEAYRQSEAGEITLDKVVTLKEEDKVPGSGILTDHFSAGMTMPLRDAIRLMIRYSDNTATNLVIDQIGLASTAEVMTRLGCPNTKIHAKVYRRDTSIFPERSKVYGLGSTTAAEMISLLELLEAGTLVSPKASQAMKEHMLTCDDAESLPRFLAPGTKIAFKTGAVNASRTAAGILETPQGPVALCVLTDKNEDQSWTADNAGTRLCAEVAAEVFKHYGGTVKKRDSQP